MKKKIVYFSIKKKIGKFIFTIKNIKVVTCKGVEFSLDVIPVCVILANVPIRRNSTKETDQMLSWFARRYASI